MTITDAETRADPGRALAWSVANTALAKLGTLVIGVVLARLLGPEEFGTFAVAMVALMAVLSFNELGVSLAIVRWERDPAEISPTVATISTVLSAVLTAAMVLAAPRFTAAMGAPEATLEVQLMALTVLVNGLVATPAALMQRNFEQRRRTVIDQVNMWVGALVSVALASIGLGATALAVGRLTGAALSGVLFVRWSPRPVRFGFDPVLARNLLGFGLPLAGASIIVFLVGFIDQLVVGRLLGPVQLGYYVLAVNLASWPLALFSQPVRMVAPALFSRMQADPEQLTRSFTKVLRPLASVALPVCAVIAVAAPEIISFVYGDAWSGAAPVLRWLAAVTAARIFFELSYDYLVVRGRTRALLRIHVVWALLLAPAVVLGVRTGGIEGAAMALTVVAVLGSAPFYVAELWTTGITTSALARAFVVALAASAGLVAMVLPVLRLVQVQLAGLALTGLCLVLVIGGTLWLARADLTVFRRAAS